MCQVAGKALCSLQAIHIALCLRRTLDEVTFERTKALYFYTEAQGQETQEQTRVRLLDKRTMHLCHMVLTQAQLRCAFSRPMLGQFGRFMPEENYTRHTRGDAAESINRALIHAGIVFRCMGKMMTLYAPAIFYESPYSSMQNVVAYLRVIAGEHPQSKLHDSVRCYFTFRKMRWCSCLDVDMTHRIESMMFEICARWEPALRNIEREAHEND